MDYVFIDGRSSSMLEDVRALPWVAVATAENRYDGKLQGHRAVVAKLHRELQKRKRVFHSFLT